MIIDGRKILYSMKGGVIQDPSIPVDGLVCYLDTKGKSNTDKHKGTLLDLSSNGNHGTLQNFNFTEGSGYENGGLKFDGVDDSLSTIRDDSLSTIRNVVIREKPFTYFVDFNISKTAMEQNSDIDLGLCFYLHRANNKIYNYLTSHPDGITLGDVNVTVGRHIFVCSMGEDYTKAKYFLDGNSIPILNKVLSDGTPVTFLYGNESEYINSAGTKKINKLMIWDRQLTDEEVQQLMEV